MILRKSQCPASFALIADDSLSLSLDPRQEKSLKSYLVYSLLFEDRVLLSDAQVIGNRNLRQLIRRDDDLIRSLSPNNFSVAIRDSVDVINKERGEKHIIESPGIRDVLDAFVNWGKCKWPQSSSALTRAEFEDPFDLEYIVGKARIENYSLEDTSASFSADVMNFLSTESVRARIGEDLVDLIVECILEWQESHKHFKKPGLGLAFFFDDLPQMLLNRQHDHLWAMHSQEVIQIAQAMYLTTLPKTLHCNPIYGQMHRQQIEFARGVGSTTERLDEDSWYDSKLRLLDFEEGISRLRADDINALRESDEHKEFRRRIRDFRGTADSLQEIRQALFHYKAKVDDHIINHFGFLRSPRPERRERFRALAILNKTSTYGGLAVAGLALGSSFSVMNALGLGFGITSFFTGRERSDEDKRERALTEADKRRALEHLESRKFPHLHAEASLARGPLFKTEVLFKSITS